MQKKNKIHQSIIDKYQQSKKKTWKKWKIKRHSQYIQSEWRREKKFLFTTHTHTHREMQCKSLSSQFKWKKKSLLYTVTNTPLLFKLENNLTRKKIEIIHQCENVQETYRAKCLIVGNQILFN